jgi:hypothetical protein
MFPITPPKDTQSRWSHGSSSEAVQAAQYIKSDLIWHEGRYDCEYSEED